MGAIARTYPSPAVGDSPSSRAGCRPSHHGLIKLTGGQRIELLGLRKDGLSTVWADRDMPSGNAHAKRFRTVKTFVGSDYCLFGGCDSTVLGIAIEEGLQGIAGPGKMRFAVTGCPATAPMLSVSARGVPEVEDATAPKLPHPKLDTRGG
jgi:hypothetical protein